MIPVNCSYVGGIVQLNKQGPPKCLSFLHFMSYLSKIADPWPFKFARGRLNNFVRN